MFGSRFAALSAAAVLGLGLAGSLAGAGAAQADTPVASPTVIQSNGTFTVALPGVGTLSFSVDASGALSKLVASPAAGLSASQLATTGEGVEVSFSGGGTARVLAVEVDREDGAVQVKAEADLEDPAKANRTDDSGHRGGGSAGRDKPAEQTARPAEQTTTTVGPSHPAEHTTTSVEDHSGSGGGRGHGGND
jgi:hypothetical protein